MVMDGRECDGNKEAITNRLCDTAWLHAAVAAARLLQVRWKSGTT